VPACRRISNTHSFPRYPDQRKKWILVVRNYIMDPKWLPTQHSRICSKHFPDHFICKVYRRADKLRPNAVPIMDKEQFPPDMRKEYPKIIPMPKIDYEAMEQRLPVMSHVPFTQTIVVKQANTFCLITLHTLENLMAMFHSANSLVITRNWWLIYKVIFEFYFSSRQTNQKKFLRIPNLRLFLLCLQCSVC